MALDASKVRVALTGRVWFVPESDTTNFPVDPVDLADPPGGIDLGYTTEDGVSFSFGKEVEDILGWQSADPLRRLVTAEPKTASFTLQQLERQTWAATMGGAFAQLAAGPPVVYRWEPNTGELPTGKLLIDMEDGGKKYRFGFRRAQNSAAVEFNLVRNAAISLPNEWAAVATADGKKSFFLDSNDAGFGPSNVPVITTASLNALRQGVAFTQTLTATGTTPITWATNAGTIPAGLSLAAGTGVLSGTPTAAGPYLWEPKATNANGVGTKVFSGTVAAP